MSALEIILLVLTIVAALWQAYLIRMAAAYVQAGYHKVRLGILPGFVALVTGTWLLFLVAR